MSSQSPSIRRSVNSRVLENGSPIVIIQSTQTDNTNPRSEFPKQTAVRRCHAECIESCWFWSPRIDGRTVEANRWAMLSLTAIAFCLQTTLDRTWRRRHGMTDQESIVEMLQCPVTSSPLSKASCSMIESINQQIGSGVIRDRSGNEVTVSLDAGFVNEDQSVLYPVRQGIIILSVDQAIETQQLSTPLEN